MGDARRRRFRAPAAAARRRGRRHGRAVFRHGRRDRQRRDCLFTGVLVQAPTLRRCAERRALFATPARRSNPHGGRLGAGPGVLPSRLRASDRPHGGRTIAWTGAFRPAHRRNPDLGGRRHQRAGRWRGPRLWLRSVVKPMGDPTCVEVHRIGSLAPVLSPRWACVREPMVPGAVAIDRASPCRIRFKQSNGSRAVSNRISQSGSRIGAALDRLQGFTTAPAAGPSIAGLVMARPGPRGSGRWTPFTYPFNRDRAAGGGFPTPSTRRRARIRLAIARPTRRPAQVLRADAPSSQARCHAPAAHGGPRGARMDGQSERPRRVIARHRQPRRRADRGRRARLSRRPRRHVRDAFRSAGEDASLGRRRLPDRRGTTTCGHRIYAAGGRRAQFRSRRSSSSRRADFGAASLVRRPGRHGDARLPAKAWCDAAPTRCPS